MQQPETLNPVVSRQFQWNQIRHLVYESLYEVNAKQEAVPVLAKDNQVSEDGLTYTIHLREGVLFHDKTSLDATDVLATIQYIQNPVNLSPYIEQLQNVAAVKVIDAVILQIVLSAVDPFFLYELNFPVLTSENIANPAVVFQPGTGPYRIARYEKGKQLDAEIFPDYRNATDFKIKTINILELNDTRAAMEAFGNDRVDLVILRDTNYETYYLRNDVKILRYPTNQYLFFAMNQNVGKSLIDTAKADYIKLVLQDPVLLDGLKSVFCTMNTKPFLTTSPLVHLNKCKDLLAIEKIANPFITGHKPLEVVYPLNDMVKELLVVQLKKVFDSEKIPYKVTGYDAAIYPAVLLAGSYDLALREAQLSANPDPSWMYSITSLRAVKGLETLSKDGTAKFVSVQTEMDALWRTAGLKITPDTFCGIMNQTYRYGPFIGIGFRINGVIQSKRIQGQLEPNTFNQYNNLKEVWVWSGQ